VFKRFPTFSIFDPSDKCLHWQVCSQLKLLFFFLFELIGIKCYIGCAASVLLILDFAPLVTVIICYLMYLSIRWVTVEFLMLQWDNLLLEVGSYATLNTVWLCLISSNIGGISISVHMPTPLLAQYEPGRRILPSFKSCDLAI